MLSQISPLDVGASNGLHYLGALGSGSGAQDASPVSGQAVGLPAAAPLDIGSAVSLVSMNNEISQLLQSIGGGVENNKMLQLMIGLLILLTLLQGSAKTGQSAADALSTLGASGGGRGTYISFAASTTSITIEQTSVTMTASAADTLAAAQGNAQPQNHRIDLAA